MNSYPIHFHAGSGGTARARLPQGLPISLRLMLAAKQVCVPFHDVEGRPLLRLCTQEEYHLWQSELPKEVPLPAYERLLQILAQYLPDAERFLIISKYLLAFADITDDAVLCLQEDGSVWLAPSQERKL